MILSEKLMLQNSNCNESSPEPWFQQQKMLNVSKEKLYYLWLYTTVDFRAQILHPEDVSSTCFCSSEVEV